MNLKTWIPLNNFAGVGANDFIYLYSRFGGLDSDHNTGDGFEEWAVLEIPAPGVLAMFALAGIAGGRRRRA